MLKILKNFILFLILVVFTYNTTGIALNVEHANHYKEQIAKTKSDKKREISIFSQHEKCQCDLHFHMNNVVLPNLVTLGFSYNDPAFPINTDTKVVHYACLLHYFSSRAPPINSI